QSGGRILRLDQTFSNGPTGPLVDAARTGRVAVSNTRVAAPRAIVPMSPAPILLSHSAKPAKTPTVNHDLRFEKPAIEVEKPSRASSSSFARGLVFGILSGGILLVGSELAVGRSPLRWIGWEGKDVKNARAEIDKIEAELASSKSDATRERELNEKAE